VGFATAEAFRFLVMYSRPVIGLIIVTIRFECTNHVHKQVPPVSAFPP